MDDLSDKLKWKGRRLYESLKTDIQSGVLLPGSILPTELELAATYGIARGTVRSALLRLAEEKMVERSKRKGTCVSAMKKKLKIGVSFLIPPGDNKMIPIAFNPFREKTIEAILKRGHEVFEFGRDEIKLAQTGEQLARLDGFVISFSCIDPDTVPVLQSLNIPVVVIQQPAPVFSPFHQVVPDLFNGFKKAVDMILADREKEIAFLTVFNDYRDLRFEIFKECLALSGFDTAKLKRITTRPAYWDSNDAGGQLAGYKVGLELLKSEKIPKMIFSCSDFLSLGLMNAFAEAGLFAGKDYKLISFDNLEGQGLSLSKEPILTSIDFPRSKIAEEAVRLTIEAIHGTINHLRTEQIPCELIIRNSY